MSYGSEDALDQFFNDVMKFLHQKYHVYPDNLPQLRTPDDMDTFREQAEQSFAQAAGNRDNVRYSGILHRWTK